MMHRFSSIKDAMLYSYSSVLQSEYVQTINMFRFTLVLFAVLAISNGEVRTSKW